MTIQTVSKLDAATRQLNMAIVLYFQDADQKVASARDKGVPVATAIKAVTGNDEPAHSILLNHIAAIFQTLDLSPAAVRAKSLDACIKGETDLSLRSVK